MKDLAKSLVVTTSQQEEVKTINLDKKVGDDNEH